MHPREGQPSCRMCGRSLQGVLYLREDGHLYCCEGCYLAQVRDKPTLDSSEYDQAVVEALINALDARECETGLHSKRVACHTLTLARRFSTEAAVLRSIYEGALLHDIGKIAIPDRILLKAAPLTAPERDEMQTHPQRGYDILAPITPLKAAAAVVLTHEERFDGQGYPNRLVGTTIPLGARLLAVIDTLDAMTSDRVYRKALSFDTAREEIIAQSGRQFDPQVVDAFLAEEPVMRQMVTLKCTGSWPTETGNN